MRGPAAGEAVAALPWLCPGADALLALARTEGSACWAALRHDPGAVLLTVRHSTAFATPAQPFSPFALQDPGVLGAALAGLREDGECTFVDWLQGAVRPVYEAALLYARTAERAAEAAGLCDPAYAWVGGLLAPLGWLAVCAADPAAAAACLADPEHDRDPAGTQTRHWGLDQAALARRLARRWGLPPWLAALVGHLGLPADIACRLGAAPGPFTAVQTAVALVQQHAPGLLKIEDLGGSGIEDRASTIEAAQASILDSRSLILDSQSFRSPAGIDLLPDLLAMAAENRRLKVAPAVRRLEDDVDVLHTALREARAGEAERLHAQKLGSLAEFAAGAGHEINNPLAVISGQAQFLLNKLRRPRPSSLVPGNGAGPESPAEHAVPPEDGQGTTDKGQGPKDDWETPLRKIIDQAQRIHQILRELMQFARPPRPNRQLFDLADLLREVVASQADLAAQRGIRLAVAEPIPPILLDADRSQVRTALACLLRNAVEAAPSTPEGDGWAAVRTELTGDGRVEVIVEDNGTGPPPAQREHLFDPFYSGRSAGRGRGLGLPTAWRLAQVHGGDVRYVPLPNGPTRFVLSLPRPSVPVAGQNGHHA